MYTKEQMEVINLQDSYTIMYALVARTIMEELGHKGESIVREATRRYGADRGRNTRKRHQAMGIKVNMENLFTVSGDLPPDPRFKRDRVLLIPEERNSHTLICPMAEVWIAYDAKKIGRIYCEEFHRDCYKEYGFGYSQVNLAQTLTEDGDEYCDFHVVLRKANLPEELRKDCFAECDPDFKEPDMEVLKSKKANAKVGFDILCIKVYYYMLEVLKEQAPDQYETIIKKALTVWAKDEAARVKKEARDEGESLTADFVDKNSPLYLDRSKEALYPEYDKYGAEKYLQEAYFPVLKEELGI